MLVRMHFTHWNTKADIDRLWRRETEPARMFGRTPQARHGLAIAAMTSVSLHCAALIVAILAARAVAGLYEVEHHPRYIAHHITFQPAITGQRLPMPSEQIQTGSPAPVAIPKTAGQSPARSNRSAPRARLLTNSGFSGRTLDIELAADETMRDGSIQMVHRPNGVADVVLEGADGELAPEIRQLLPDGPVRTVYCEVGAAREWVLHYSIPDAEPQIEMVNSMVIRLPEVVHVAAPYPLVTVVPAALAGPQKEPVTIYAELDTAGRVHNVRLVKGRVAEPSVWEKLSNWLFRPATRNGSAVSLKLILVVPAANAGEVG